MVCIKKFDLFQYTPADLEMAERIKDCIKSLDRSAFPFRPTRRIYYHCYGFSAGIVSYSFISDAYFIYAPGLNSAFESKAERDGKFWSPKCRMTETSYCNLPPITKELHSIEVAGHEVRHRAQCLLGLTLLDSQTSRESDYLNMAEEIASLKFECVAAGYKKNEAALEIDAIALGAIVADMWHSGERNLARLGMILASDPYEMVNILDLERICRLDANCDSA